MSFISPVGAYPQYDTPAAYTTPSSSVSITQAPVTPVPTAVSPYQQQLDTLTVADNQELISDAFGSTTGASSNLLDVLAQAAQAQADGYASSVDTTA